MLPKDRYSGRGRFGTSRSACRSMHPPTAGSTATGSQKGQRLITLERTVTLPDAPRAYRVVAATDETELTAAVAAFTRTLVLSLGVLAFALFAAAAIQIRVGLRPLHRLRNGVAAIREGRIKRLEGPFPTETQPLVDDLNALLQRNEEVVARGRVQAGNLAHGLKTPLSILANEVDRLAADGAPQRAVSMRVQIATHPSTCRARACRLRRPSRRFSARWHASMSVAICSSRSTFRPIMCSAASSRTSRKCSAT